MQGRCDQSVQQDLHALARTMAMSCSTQSHSRPLIVYLDSSDFSVLSDNRQKTEMHMRVEQRLLDWQEAGAIQLRFSYAHVIEAAAVRQTDVGAARSRLLHIQRLCGKSALVDPFSLFEAEVRAVAQAPQKQSWSSVYRDDGYWMPPLGDLGIEFPSLATSLEDALASTTNNRAERRRAKRLFDSTGRLRTAKQLPADELGPEVHRQLDQYPLTAEGRRQVIRFIRGHGSKAQVLEAIESSMIDLRTFSEWYERQWDRTAPLSQFLRKIGDDLRQSMQDARLGVQRAHEALQGTGASHKTTPAIQAALDDGLRSVPDSMLLRLASVFGLSLSESAHCSWEQTPSLLAVSQILCHVARLSALPANGGRPSKASDLGDALHAIYLPYVDILRVDGFTGNAIKDARLPCPTTVVTKLLELPAAIEKRLQTQSDAKIRGAAQLAD